MDIVPELSPTTAPRLPPELERVIFEVVAMSDARDIPILMRVAWRVKHWVQPLLYRTIVILWIENASKKYDFPVISVRILLDMVTRKQSLPLRQFCREMFWDTEERENEEDDFERILAACPNITNLFFYPMKNTAQYIPMLNRMHRLTRFASHLNRLFDPHPVDFGYAFLRNVTHLELLDDDIEVSDYLLDRLRRAPCLTHVAFDLASGIAALHACIRAFTQLQCIVFLQNDILLDVEEPETDDDRFVCIRQSDFRADWIRGATTGIDYWTIADGFIAAKRAGKTDRSNYLIADTDVSWIR
ncbi:hypothetical protein R3P38DRAFT_3399097 [Favolaschia claudopus]|uniref:F-box domain-containing protein n=1 Tax=Favolaschia claudopus TaxID=2862362 RepID=A0AAW0AZ97_9AGAR